MILSKRLKAVAELVPAGLSVADVGTDHGYIPIYLKMNGIVPKVIAMDINEGPLERAIDHIQEYGLQSEIDTRISDGVEQLKAGEVDGIICSGMGGQTVISILTNGMDTVRKMKYMILQPQAEIDRVRRFLAENDFVIVAEDMVEEDGKYYQMMRAVPVENLPENSAFKVESYEEFEFLYGKRLLENKHPIMHRYLKREKTNKMSIIMQLSMLQGVPSIDERIQELGQEMNMIKAALECYKI